MTTILLTIQSYLNINHLSNHGSNLLHKKCSKSPIDYLCIDEAKLDFSYPDTQF